MRIRPIIFLLCATMLVFAACKKKQRPKDPNTAEKVSVDRFSDEAGTLMQRSANPGLPAANAAINYDQEPFLSMGLGPNGNMVEYYNFDVQSTTPAPIYVLFREGESSPVPDQLNIVDVVPGDAGYNDFWQVVKVTVPDDYEANVVTSLSQIQDEGYSMEMTNMLVNCPIVPEGSTASKRVGGGETGLTRGWYKDKIVFYFNFVEKSLTTTSSGKVPLSPIYVSFNKNPDPNDPTSGPASGFMTETGTMQTHNVVATVPTDAGYSPLWMVNIYDNADFSSVMDLATAQAANILVNGAANVNCPIVSM